MLKANSPNPLFQRGDSKSFTFSNKGLHLDRLSENAKSQKFGIEIKGPMTRKFDKIKYLFSDSLLTSNY